jgi:hypothetical protein
LGSMAPGLEASGRGGGTGGGAGVNKSEVEATAVPLGSARLGVPLASGGGGCQGGAAGG